MEMISLGYDVKTMFAPYQNLFNNFIVSQMSKTISMYKSV